MKLLNLYPEQVAYPVREVFAKYSTSAHLELQQRACEYIALPSVSPDTMETVLNPMPPFEVKKSASHNSGESADKVANASTAVGSSEAAKQESLRIAAPVQKVSYFTLFYTY